MLAMNFFASRDVSFGAWALTVGIALLAGWLAGRWYEEDK